MGILKKIWNWIDDRSGLTEMFEPMIKHLVPPGSKWSYVFGSATLFCLVLQVITGIALSLLYQPSSSGAYQSLLFITNKAAFGNVLRGVHYFGASGMIIMVGIHMIRVYLTAAYKFPREMAWISGVFLLFLTIAMGFTGQLLRWDANGVWSSVVAAEQMGRIPLIGKYVARLLLGGDTIGGHTLSRFYSYHVFVIPAIIFIFLAYHLMLVIRNGISEPAKAGRPVDPKKYREWYHDMLKKIGVPFWPYSAWRDLLFGAATIIAIISLAIIFGPPELTQPPDPSFIYTNPTPDWYMLSIFSLFALMPPEIESYVIFIGPGLTIIILLSLPFISNKGERSPIRRPWAVFGVLCVVIFILSLFLLGQQSAWSPKFDVKPLAAKVVHSTDSVVIKGASLLHQRGCLFCHSIAHQGGLKGPDLSEVALRLSKKDITIRIVNGGPNMPAYGGILSNQDLTAIVTFLETRK
ncbi:MAG: cytochrome b N-terminal domain-containing protein [Candidatus Pedobacter colombiensis]|uniref:Cytochrome b N-terminal domain-containing protein n=1 Tax=Candidatus Pedobacter colombiensis TaxID=3121371 RepID=A0AAJ5WC55_9SPHI|nr:cytochrome b N-terminal domain-containing protein [Pedobacter sp.]WEK21575.1 MAG: cytochrome b N-terminal domain-containing protein [Pedobacter sp.]